MKKSSLFMIILAAVLVLSSIAVFAVSPNDIKVNITIGVGEKRAVTNYTKNSSSQVIWTTQNSAVAAVVGTDIVGNKVGTTIINGKSNDYTYTIVVKVLENSIEAVTSNEKVSTGVVKSDGSTINYTNINLSIGIGDSVDITGLLPKPYYKYLWRVNNTKYLTCSRGVLKGSKEGIVTVTAAGNTSETKNAICRFNITVDSNIISKTIKVSKNKDYNLNQYVGDAENFTFTVLNGQGGSVTVKDGGIMQTPTTTGTCIVTAESLIGEKNYTLVVKTI